ncbi:MAG: alpha/beta hydrolase [Ilumatobacteraceae bacterium]
MPAITLGSGLSLSYWTQGEVGDATVVLLPGPTDSWRSYQPILDAVPSHLRVIAVSLRGHGDSSKPGSGYSIEHLTADVVPLLDALEIERATLVGHSGSGLVARRVACQAPDRVSGLVLEATPTTLRNDPKLREFVNTVVSELTDPIDPDFARTFVADTSTDVLPVELLEALVEDLVKVPVRVWNEMFASLLVYDDTTELSLINVPALLVWGDADPLVPRSMQDDLARSIPRTELVVYRGVGHTPRWEEPARFANDVARFALNASSQPERSTTTQPRP